MLGIQDGETIEDIGTIIEVGPEAEETDAAENVIGEAATKPEGDAGATRTPPMLEADDELSTEAV